MMTDTAKDLNNILAVKKYIFAKQAINKTFVVANIEQKILFWTQIRGEISGGMWARSQPRDHYKFWSTLDFVKDIGVGSNIGTYAENHPEHYTVVKNDYDLTNTRLLKLYGNKMIFTIKMYKYFNNDIINNIYRNNLAFPESVDNYLEVAEEVDNSNYYRKLFNSWEKIGLDDVTIYNVDKIAYDKKMLISDLKSIKESMQNVNY